MRFTAGSGLAVLLLATTSIAPSQAFWTDEEASGADLYAGVVPGPQYDDCYIPRNSPVDRRYSVSNLGITWTAPEASSRDLDVEGYRFDFYAVEGHPEPRQASTGTIPGFSYTNFADYLTDPSGFLLTDEVRYEIHLVSEGPGDWESDPLVLEIWIRDGGLLTPNAYECAVEDASGQQWGTFDFEEAPSEGDPDELPLEEGEAVDEEIEGDDSTSAPSRTPTEQPASPEGGPEVDGSTSTTSPAPMDESASPGEDESLEPEASPTEPEPSESGAEQEAEESSDEEDSPGGDEVPESGEATALDDPQG